MKMTVRELCERMDSREFSYWLAFHRFYEPLPDPWFETGIVASAALAPYCSRGKTPKPSEFVPVEKPPQHETQIIDQLRQLKEALESDADG